MEARVTLRLLILVDAGLCQELHARDTFQRVTGAICYDMLAQMQCFASEGPRVNLDQIAGDGT